MSANTTTNNKNSSTSTINLDIPVNRITDKIYIIYGPLDLPNEKNHGFRNNPLIVLTSEGVVICDPGGSASAGQMVVERVKEITNAPVVAVFDSHGHGDHWLGNEAIKDAYPHAVIYGHERMQSKLNNGDGLRWLDLINKLTNGSAHGTRVVAPDKTVSNGDIVTIGDTSFRIHHTGTAHTDGDIMVEIVEERALFLGDIVRNEFLGVMEEDSSFQGNIAAIDFLLKNKSDIKYYIPGHGRVGDARMLKQYQAYLSILYNKVKMLYATGIADYEMKPEIVKDLSKFQSWKDFDMRVGSHISRAYLEIEAQEF